MALVDTNLVVRYYLDEAASGSAPTTIADASGNAFDLDTINYASGNMAWTEVSGNRGLQSTSNAGDQSAKKAVNDTADAVRTALGGAQKVTMEFVMDMSDTSVNGYSRMFGMNAGSDTFGSLMLVAESTTSFDLSWKDNTAAVSGFNLAPSSRAVYHLVVDTTQATQADRCKIYKDGSEITSKTVGLTLNDTLTIPASTDLILMNRNTASGGDRTFVGRLYYFALYAGALSSGDVTTNYGILTTSDDTPISAATFEQEGYRIRNDDGSESSASWKAAQDTAVSMTLGAARVRVLLDATNDPASKAVGLKYAVNGGQKRSVN